MPRGERAAAGTGPEAALRAPGGPASRRTRIGPQARGGQAAPAGARPDQAAGQSGRPRPGTARGPGAGSGTPGGGRPTAGAPARSAAFSWPRPTSTRLPTRERTIWWQKDVGRDLEAQQPALRRRPASAASGPCVDAPAGRRSPGARSARRGRSRAGRRQKDRKSWLPEQHVGGGRHGAQVERVAHVPGERGQQRVGRRGVPDQVAVGRPVAERRASKSGRTASARRTTTAGASWRLQGSGQPGPSSGDAAGRSTWTTWPRACTPASVRPAQVSDGGSVRRAVRPRAWRSAPATVGTSGWAAKPRKAAPS